MSGLIALLDDVAGIAKVAAAQIDDVAAQAAKAGAKAAGAVIDDAAVTPKYVHGFSPARELPIVGKIALGSIRNKLLILLPLALLLSNFAPWLITPLLMLGGSYLCFEGAEKVWHLFRPGTAHADGHVTAAGDPVHLEQQKVAGAIKTDFILSAEIMTIALAAVEAPNVWIQAGALALVGVGVTVAVYGSVGLIVKMDDVGLYFARNGRTVPGRALGRWLVRAMPVLMRVLSVIGTAAMLWVGGSIIVHGLEVLGFGWLGHHIHDLADTAAHTLPAAWLAAAGWIAAAAMYGLFGLGLGLVLIPLVTRVLAPLWARVSGGDARH